MIIDGGLRSIFRQQLPHFHWVTIESGATDQGIPDSEFCHNGQTGWVEYKKTNGWVVPLNPSQVGWHMRRARSGGRSFIAVRKKKELWLFAGASARDLKLNGFRDEKILEQTMHGMWMGGPANWNWHQIETILTRSIFKA
jgi:hypothetical protein